MTSRHRGLERACIRRPERHPCSSFPRTLARDLDALAATESVIIPSMKSTRNCAWTRTRPDGRVIEVRRNAVPSGGFVLIYSDITERKRSEAEIHTARDAAEAAYRDLKAAQANLIQAEKMASLGQLTGFESQRNPRDLFTGPDRLIAPAMQQTEQPFGTRLQLLARLTLNLGKHTGNQPARLAHLDDGNDCAILVQGDEGPAQVVQLGHQGTPSVGCSDDGAISLYLWRALGWIVVS